MITPKEFVNMKNTAKQLLECIFQTEDSFCDTFVSPYRCWDKEDYTLERTHVSGCRLRVTLKFYDGGDKDLYFKLDDVCDWCVEEYNKRNK